MKTCVAVLTTFGLVYLLGFVSLAKSSQGEDADLAQDLANPIADLITLPVQMNYDSNIGPSDEGTKIQTNIQPVIPFGLNEEWNIITRTIMPVIYQEDIVPDAGSQFGLGDTSLTMFFSPKKSNPGGIMWGIGPILLAPTATEPQLGGEKWGAGPSGIVLKEIGSWTVGALANHVWSFAGDSDRLDINNSFIQPFAAYTWPTAWTVSLQSETTYNWESESWSVPINFAVSKLVWMGKLPVSLQAGVGYWLESPDSGSEGYRFRLQANFVLPR
ncbi:transporter [Desulforhopalus sp. 52FAK]